MTTTKGGGFNIYNKIQTVSKYQSIIYFLIVITN
jgi:hypothetical protein